MGYRSGRPHFRGLSECHRVLLPDWYREGAQQRRLAGISSANSLGCTLPLRPTQITTPVRGEDCRPARIRPLADVWTTPDGLGANVSGVGEGAPASGAGEPGYRRSSQSDDPQLPRPVRRSTVGERCRSRNTFLLPPDNADLEWKIAERINVLVKSSDVGRLGRSVDRERSPAFGPITARLGYRARAHSASGFL